MATITLKNVPDDLHNKLKAQAERNRRSLNQEAIEILSDGLADTIPSPALDPEAFLAHVKKTHDSMEARGICLTNQEVLDAINFGRE
ncbi:MAG: Arc family DNA-binding protein [Rhodothermales bacterium]|nr:Arc family DNA-binding protein [Rhodothermales bacterium]MBO6780076.1 Arc family DNA-binding protein [Rhodothermales bacterium]